MLQIFYPQIKLEKVNAEEFYDIYKGVVIEYTAMVQELSSGPLIALEIHTKSDDTARQFRDFCGPADPVSLEKTNCIICIIHQHRKSCKAFGLSLLKGN